MSLVTVALRKLAALLLGFFSVFRTLYRKLVCRTRSNRRMSGSILPLVTEHRQPEALGEIQQSLPSNEVSTAFTA